MADQVPVCDVLCEAMEYLSKLGSNLRTRSENLREKRISKEKLRNSHAIQKAANKVLLICELSKKSLENVETGVRRIMSAVSESQTSSYVGGKSSTDKSENKSRFKHFSYEKRNLRVLKTVPVKHYMSVKVRARRMPASMQDKYPVYHDCKLYRLRKKKQKETRKRSESENENNKKEENTSDTDKKKRRTSDSDSENIHLEYDNDEPGEEIRNSIECSKPTDFTDNEESSVPETTTKTVEDNKFNKNNENKVDKNSEDSCQNDEDPCANNSLHDSNDAAAQMNVDNDNVNKSVTKSPEKVKSPKGDSKHRKHRDSMEISCSKEEKEKSPKKDSKHRKHRESVDTSCSKSPEKAKSHKNDSKHRKHRESSESESKLAKEKESKMKRFKHIQMVEDSSDSNKEETMKQLSKKNKDNSSVKVESENDKSIGNGDSYEHKTKKRRTSESVAESNKDSKENDTKEKNETSQNDVQENPIRNKGDNKTENVEAQPTRPMIKCVNINKLLKSDLSTVENAAPGQVSSTKKKTVTINEHVTYMERPERKMSQEKEEKYWAQKRKEVKAFKPKKFDINVVRLPTLSVSFLKKHNLKKITRNGCTILCDEAEKAEDDVQNTVNNIISMISDLSSQNSNKNENSQNPSKSTDLNKVKSALLNDSDSDKNDGDKSDPDNDLSKEAEKVKNALLNDSDSDKNVENLDAVVRQNIDEAVNKNKDEEKEASEAANVPSRNIENKNEDPNEVKSSLLNDSSGDSPEKHDKRKKQKDSPHQSKRKKIMESMHAKKMLLTYSSSSDSEDEQVKSALKEIKESLLKEISSPETDLKALHRKKSLASSDESDSNKKKKVKKKLNLSPKPQETDKKTEEGTNEPQIDEQEKNNNSSQEEKMDENSDSTSSKISRSREGNPSSSSTKNSDSQDSNDKDIDGLTNLKSLNRVRRRRGSTSTNQSASTNSTKKNKKMPKAPPILGENVLKAESSSEASDAAASGAESEVEEDLPQITLSGVNGSGLGHIAKDDLLGESDSSSSHTEKDKSDEIKREDSDSEANVKSKRRKANAISSDSEAGSSRRQKALDEKDSDFEDSEEESSEPVKGNKRKKKGPDSDASMSSSNDESGGKKKRRRIKQVKDSDASGSDTENEGRNKHGRKNIRKVMGKNQLEEATKKAAREEKERIARIAERQKLYNNLEFDESGKPDEVVLEKVILDFDPETKEPLIQVDRGLVKKLKPHQANGIKFMWNACFESVKRIKKDRGSGCILAHCMGLGKTLQVVSLTHTLLTHGDLTNVKRVLVVCPLSTVLNWVNEFKMWLKHAETEYDVDVYELSRHKQNVERAYQLQQWFEGGGVCVLGYEMFRNLSADNNKKFKKKMLRTFQESLVDPGPDLVVCDEGHLLKNEKTSLSQSMNRVKTRRRIVLTGTPLQNNLKEYYCMVQFVKPNLLGKYNEYLNRFVNPITNGQYTDSTEHDIRVMKRRSHVLHKMLDGAVQRRDYGVLAPFLPPKHEYVLFITLSQVQVKLYQFYLDNYSRRPLPGKSSGFLFPDFQSLQRIWTHPLVLKYNSERYEIMQQKKREREEEDSEGSLVDFIDDDSTPDESSTEESSDDLSDLSDDSRKKSKKKKSAKKSKAKEGRVATRRGTRANPVELDEEEANNDVVEVKNENPTEWWIRLVSDDELEDMRNSHKLVLLFDILRQCETIGDKLLVFSQSLYSLDLIEHFLGKVDEATQEGRIDEKLGGHVGSWSPGVDYFRLDGSTSCENRSIWCKNFNREDNPRARLFLISTRAGGLGINLVAANRVVIFDVSWNPSHDVQSIFRVYRFGQKKPCYIYRFLAMGTMEEKIYERQVTKQAISKRVIDEQQIDRHYAENDLAELYKFEPAPPHPRELPPLPKDRLFAEMLKEHEPQIYKYHEHDSLLENKEEETLTEEERKAAWEDFENEKNRPPPAPFPSAWPMHNGMVPGLLAQQQQQLAYAALAAMLRKDMPNINDNQIRDMLPLIYNSNPAMFGGYDYGLMQKMSEIYKYAQPGMMNPGMMNPGVMNAASGGGGGGGGGSVGGTSGLQYEPPWQRQQQQQQQMRLQQLMQAQSQMGAKFYAGGLGSRDPVAMALQQQRAREMMLGERARPRGRPPLQPRAPPPLTHHADVVNLADSD